MKRIKPLITAERLRELVSYDPATGQFAARVARRGPKPANGHLGNITTSGYRTVMVDGLAYQAHRLAWLFMTGAWPKGEPDHRDLNKANNRWGNLREATHSQNCANQRGRNSSGGLKGVAKTRDGKFQAAICVEGKDLYLGRYESAEEAGGAYARAAKDHFGEFARTE